ncbi:MAG: prolyl oligopeptidase family serine peptidase [Melioribacteraceae bacterium]|nr:prolyl oligopeptidase family serine peptidase [Melioribacteraceae bacterium]
MLSKIIERRFVELNPTQQKMIKSGWGNESIDNTIVENITYLSDRLKVKGYIAYPKDQSKKYPCIIWCRGGIGNAGAIDEFNASGIFGQIASWGYVVFASQYRGNAGGDGKDEFGGSDVNDVLNLISLADEIDCADKSCWGIEGWSRGGMMTYLTLTRTDIFKAAIVIGGIANLRCNSEESKFMKRLYEITMGKSETENFKQSCESRSIINYPDKLAKNTPLLLLHGTADDRVLVHDSIDLAEKLKELNHPHELVLYENGDHFLKSHRKDINEKRKEWLKKYLSD